MRNVASFTLFFITAVALCVYIMYSSYIHKEAVEKELIITEACKTFLDTVADKGALAERDYVTLTNNLSRTGGAFRIVLTIERMYPIPDSAGGYVMEYRPAYGYSSDEANFPVYVDVYNNGTQFLKKFDLMSLSIEQTAMMTYQTNQLRQMSMVPGLRTWSFSRGVRSSGNSIVNNEEPPIDFD